MRVTKTVQVYPSDDIVNATISENQSFGWEVIGNQRCQEYDGQTRDFITGSTTNHYSTFNKITFSRENSAPWYDEVTKLESEYYILSDTAKNFENYRPVLRKVKPDGAIGVMLGIYLYLMGIVPGIIYSVVRSCKKSKYKKQYRAALAAYEEEYPAKIAELNRKTAEIRRRAENCISGRA